MKFIIRIASIIAGVLIYLFIVATKPDAFHSIAAAIGGLIVGGIFVFWGLVEEKTIKTEIAAGNEESEVRMAHEEPIWLSIIVLIFFAALVVGFAWTGANIGERIDGIYTLFYDRGYEQFKHDLELRDDPEKKIAMLDDRLSAEDIPAYQREELNQMKYEVLVQWGLDLRNEGNEQAAKAKWQEAINWAEGNNVNPALAKSYLAGTQFVEITPTPVYVAPPRGLPDGSIVEVTNAYTDTNTLFLNLDIRQPDGEYVGDLLPTDFTIWCNGQLVDPGFVAVESFKNLASSRKVDLVIDASGSMGSDGGLPMQSVISGTTTVIRTLRPNDRVRLIIIASKVERVTAWMSPDEALAEVAQLQAVKGGSTAFWDGMNEATNNVEAGGPHLIIGLTDGADNASKATPNELLKVYSGSKASVILVAITSDQFKPDALSDFATAIGGKFLSANVEGLPAVFDSIAKETTSQYRVTVFTPGIDVRSFKIVVGNNTEPVEQLLP